MAMYDNVKSKLGRQELEAMSVGQHFTHYTTTVKYTPEHIEEKDFFNLCYNFLKKGDEITLRTVCNRVKKEESYDIIYKFIVIGVDFETKSVDTVLLKKVDTLCPENNAQVNGIDTEALTKAIDIIVTKKLAVIQDKLDTLTKAYEKYTEDTDNQLEEIENNISSLLTKK